ncbi:MAG: class I SAM-dependent methyltransferase [Solirubrobacteraceae bacterium]
MNDALLDQQLRYYRARAGEYDRWWLRQGRYDRGPQANARWFDEVAELERVLERFDPRGRVLELAGGTGLWTQRLAPLAQQLTVVDAAPEVLELNRARVADPSVRYVHADLFAWEPEPGAYDACAFAFWLSHVPSDRFAAFWDMVGTALAPGGRALVIDSARTPLSTAADHRLSGDGEGETMTRRLDDGSEYEIVKRFYEPAALVDELAALRWEALAQSTGEFFIWAVAEPSRNRTTSA